MALPRLVYQAQIFFSISFISVIYRKDKSLISNKKRWPSSYVTSTQLVLVELLKEFSFGNIHSIVNVSLHLWYQMNKRKDSKQDAL